MFISGSGVELEFLVKECNFVAETLVYLWKWLNSALGLVRLYCSVSRLRDWKLRWRSYRVIRNSEMFLVRGASPRLDKCQLTSLTGAFLRKNFLPSIGIWTHHPALGVRCLIHSDTREPCACYSTVISPKPYKFIGIPPDEKRSI